VHHKKTNILTWKKARSIEGLDSLGFSPGHDQECRVRARQRVYLTLNHACQFCDNHKSGSHASCLTYRECLQSLSCDSNSGLYLLNWPNKMRTTCYRVTKWALKYGWMLCIHWYTWGWAVSFKLRLFWWVTFMLQAWRDPQPRWFNKQPVTWTSPACLIALIMHLLWRT